MMTVLSKEKFDQTDSGIDFEFLAQIHNNHPEMPCRKRWILYLEKYPQMLDMVQNPNSSFKFIMIADDDPEYQVVDNPELQRRQAHLLLMWKAPNGKHVLIDATPGLEASKHTNFRALKSHEHSRAFNDVFSDIEGFEANAIRESVDIGLKDMIPAMPIVISSHRELSQEMQ